MISREARKVQILFALTRAGDTFQSLFRLPAPARIWHK
jgi:putative effector of murein hydrolase LrgA (UPF0299 family)